MHSVDRPRIYIPHPELQFEALVSESHVKGSGGLSNMDSEDREGKGLWELRGTLRISDRSDRPQDALPWLEHL